MKSYNINLRNGFLQVLSACLLVIISGRLCAQQTAEQISIQQSREAFKRPLEDVLKNIEQRYQVKLEYQTKNIRGKVVTYADWRFRVDIKETLDNVLKPLDMIWKERMDGIYEVTNFEYFRKDFSEGQKRLNELLTLYNEKKAWEIRKDSTKKCMLQALGINLAAKRNNLKPIIRSKRIMDGYTVENVAFESIPGYFVCGSLYRPISKGPHPAILSPHGHFYNDIDKFIQDERGRYRPDMQYRCAALAKMGAIVLDYDMYSYGESVLQSGSYNFHKTGFALAIQTWNSMRALDFLFSLSDVDKDRIGVTGASGGGTQTFLIAALDKRITASCPVVMVSSSFYGGCNCESGLPIHACGNTNNAEVAAMMAPRAQLVVSDGNDWTQTVPSIEFPYLKKVYSLYGQEKNISNAHLPDDHHDYGYTKRVPMYEFFAKEFQLNIKAIKGRDGEISENGITIETSNAQLVFGEKFPLPAYALRNHEEIVKAFERLQHGLN